jgi:hypothetical protein
MLLKENNRSLSKKGDYDLLVAVAVGVGLIHSTIGPTIASKKITLATTNHSEAYVYRP